MYRPQPVDEELPVIVQEHLMVEKKSRQEAQRSQCRGRLSSTAHPAEILHAQSQPLFRRRAGGTP